MHASGVLSLCAASPKRSLPSSSRPRSEGVVVWPWVICSLPSAWADRLRHHTSDRRRSPIVIQTKSAFQTPARESLGRTNSAIVATIHPSAQARVVGDPFRTGLLVGLRLPSGPGSSVTPKLIVGVMASSKGTSATPHDQEALVLR